MGFMDKFTNLFGDKKPDTEASLKGPSMVLKEHGIDPSGLKFKFQTDGKIGVSGSVGNQGECDRICEVLESMPTVTGVENNMIIAAAEPVAEPEPEPAPELAPETTVAVAKEEAAPEATDSDKRTYTVKSGDTLSAIAREFYGKGSKYMKIFEANTHILDNPDRIRPGQVLFIPEEEE